MDDFRVESVLDIGAELGEHPMWSAADQCLYWLDILSSTINRFDPETGENTAWTLPVQPGCFVFREDGGVLIAAQDGFYEMEFATGVARRILASTHDPKIMRFNDGRTDRRGRFWVGNVRVDMDLSATEDNAYYRYDGRTLEKRLTGIGINNGTAFSPDGKTMYRAQTESRQVFAYDYDSATGTPSNQRMFAVIPNALGMPDGATIDTEGGYWVALSQPPGAGPKGGVARFTPDGALDQHIELPVPFVTMSAFGGPDLSTLYITTGRIEVVMPGKVPPGAGGLFRVRTRFQGMPETPFRPA